MHKATLESVRLQYASHSFGRTLRGLREAKRISLRKFAVKCGITAGYMSDIELSRRLPGADIVLTLIRELNLSAKDQKSLVVALMHSRVSLKMIEVEKIKREHEKVIASLKVKA